MAKTKCASNCSQMLESALVYIILACLNALILFKFHMKHDGLV